MQLTSLASGCLIFFWWHVIHVHQLTGTFFIYSTLSFMCMKTINFNTGLKNVTLPFGLLQYGCQKASSWCYIEWLRCEGSSYLLQLPYSVNYFHHSRFIFMYELRISSLHCNLWTHWNNYVQFRWFKISYIPKGGRNYFCII